MRQYSGQDCAQVTDVCSAVQGQQTQPACSCQGTLHMGHITGDIFGSAAGMSSMHLTELVLAEPANAASMQLPRYTAEAQNTWPHGRTICSLLTAHNTAMIACCTSSYLPIT
jgi:hypothetical protein